MKIIPCFIALFFFGIAQAQEPAAENTSAEFEMVQSKEAEAKDAAVKLVEDFIAALNKKDTAALRKFAYRDIVMKSVAVDSAGSNEISQESYSGFLKSMAAMPRSTTFDERIHSYAVHTSGELASVLTPYSVYVNDQLEHCGVNSFQLIKIGEEWKILYLVDTRMTEGCKKFENRERSGGETKRSLDKAPDFGKK